MPSPHESPRTLADVIPPLHTHNETAAVKRINRAAANHHSLSCYNNELHSTAHYNMTEPPVSCIHPYHDTLSLPEASTSEIANQFTMSDDASGTITSLSGDDANASTTTAPFFDRVSSKKKRSISLDTATNDPDRRDESRTTTTYESSTKEELILALQSRDHLISTLDESNSHNNKRIKTTPSAIPSPSPTVSSTSSSSLDGESAGNPSGLFKATAAKKKKEQPPTAVVTEVVTPAPASSQIDDAKMEQFRKLAFQGIKAQITWRPSCKSGTARFVHGCMCDEATFRAFLNLGEKDKTKGYKYDVGAFQKDILRNVLMVRIRYGYLSLNGDVRVSYNKKLSEMKITGSFGV